MYIRRILSRLEQSGSDDDKHQQALEDTGFWGKAGAGGLFLAKSTGRFMFALRSPHVQEPHTWGTWGGAMDEGEDPKTAAKREMFEETKYRGTVEMQHVYTFHDQESGFRYFNFFAIIPDEFKPKLDWENSNYRWVAYGDWPKPLHFGAKTLITKMHQGVQQRK